ncbi:MAG: exodeoxyribonuclease VII small subunit [Patescibacteria group bacterium]
MPVKKNDFNKMFSELENITAELEIGELDLDKSVEKFEKGLKIAAQLKQRLTSVENKIKTLKK